ncbi:MAG: hypothetical protein M3Q66_01360 [Chloroflexota bacterium]|nr:hypothetical protein [Chloroflexota bacterium]
MIDPTSLRRRPAAIDRSADRVVAVASIALAVAFLAAAALSLLLPAADRRGAWLPLHLALAGAATTAIAGVMPFFAAAFAAAPPMDARLRGAAVAAVASGALGVSAGFAGAVTGLAVAGGCVYVAGILLTGAVTIRPLGRALGPSRGLITQGYVAALIEVAIGATLAILLLAGWSPMVEAWGRLKPVHAWLNLVGFVSVVVATTLLHFFPTVVGARIVVRPSARVVVAGLAGGAPLAALGMAIGSDAMARIGAIAVAAGALGLVVNAAATWRTRARWTTDPGWHGFAIGCLVAAIGWFALGIGLLAARVLIAGAGPAGWAIDPIGGPLVAGWLGLALLGSATHLLPAVGPGDQAAHARQRSVLGRWPAARLIGANAGVAGVALGWPLRIDAVAIAGALALIGSLAATTILLAAAILTGRRRVVS